MGKVGVLYEYHVIKLVGLCLHEVVGWLLEDQLTFENIVDLLQVLAKNMSVYMYQENNNE